MKIQTVKDTLTYSFPNLDGESLACHLVLYISEKCLDDPTFGKTKLNKILWFSDFVHYMETGKPITGIEYLHKSFGAVPRVMDELLDAMQAEGEIRISKRRVVNYDRLRPIKLGNDDADISMFTAQQIALVDEYIRLFWGKRAKDVSDFSHLMAYEVTDDYEPIPYEASLLSDRDISPSDIVRTKELVKQYDWTLENA